MDEFMQVIGFVGAAALLTAYYKNSRKHWSVDSLHYPLVNLCGALMICANTYYFEVYGPLLLNVFWAVVALNSIRKRLSPPSNC